MSLASIPAGNLITSRFAMAFLDSASARRCRVRAGGGWKDCALVRSEARRLRRSLIRWLSSERIQAIAVSLPWWMRWVCQNAHPHITVSWVENAEPVESNEMLVRPLACELVRFQVQCQIQFKPFEK